MTRTRKRRRTRTAAQRRATARMLAANRARRAGRPRRRARRNLPVGSLLNKPRRRRSYAMTRYRPRRRYRSNPANPAVMGIQLPAMQDVLFASVGFLAPPYLSAMVTPYLPAGMNTRYGKLAVDAGAVFLLSWGTKEFIGRSESKAVMVGGAVYLLTELLREFLPVAGTAGMRAYLNVPQGRRYVAGMKAQPFLGSGLRGLGTATSHVPARLDAGNRF